MKKSRSKGYDLVFATVLFVMFATILPASGEGTTLTSSPDTYNGVYAGSRMLYVPVIDNDASENSPDVMVCRLRPTDAQYNVRSSFGYSSLQDGNVEIFIDPDYRGATVKLVYQLCDKTTVGPETLITVNVKPLRLVHARVIKGKRIKLGNPNPNAVRCLLSDGSGEARGLYWEKSIPAGRAVIVNARYHVSDWACVIGRYKANAGEGRLVANRVR